MDVIGRDDEVERFPWPNKARGGPATLTGFCVYFVFDIRSDELLYIGCTNNIKRRISEHHATKRYRREDTRVEVERFTNIGAAARRELLMVRSMNPRDNERLVRRSRKDVAS